MALCQTTASVKGSLNLADPHCVRFQHTIRPADYLGGGYANQWELVRPNDQIAPSILRKPEHIDRFPDPTATSNPPAFKIAFV